MHQAVSGQTLPHQQHAVEAPALGSAGAVISCCSGTSLRCMVDNSILDLQAMGKEQQKRGN